MRRTVAHAGRGLTDGGTLTCMVRVILPLLAVLSCAVLLPGCRRTPRDPDGAQVRIEAELIPAASLQREDLANVHSFIPGEGRLLVISRIVSAPDPAGDYRIERLWVHLPSIIEPGRAFPLHTLQTWDIAYDAGRYEGQIQARQVDVQGAIDFVMQTADYAVFDVDLAVTPRHRQPWQLRGTLVVPITRDGFHARGYQFGRRAVPVEPVKDHPFTHAAFDGSVVGRWRGVYQREQRSDYEVHLQLDADGRFVMATGRDATRNQSYEPGMKFGRYRAAGNYLILHVDRYVMGRHNADLTDRLDDRANDQDDHRMIILRVAFDHDALLLTGDWRHPLASRHDTGPVTLRLVPADFPDLHAHRPKADREPGYDPIPQPQHAWQAQPLSGQP